MKIHTPVLQKQVIEYLNPNPNENFIDATINGGGHSLALLERIKPKGSILGIEIDKDIFNELNSLKIDGLVLINDSYANLEKIVQNNNFNPVNGILFDLGMSSWHLEKSGRGFTFLKDEPLDMRYSLDNDLTCEKILNTYSEKDIENILREYGEERFSKKIAKRIIESRPIKTTFDLKKLIPERTKLQRTFQALRIAVNDELNNLKKALPQALRVLSSNGRLIVISFHSLEDRIVKNFFKDSGLKVLCKKPIMASEQEIRINPRSRSAKLRALLKA